MFPARKETKDEEDHQLVEADLVGLRCYQKEVAREQDFLRNGAASMVDWKSQIMLEYVRAGWIYKKEQSTCLHNA